jgi:hypothetical protein
MWNLSVRAYLAKVTLVLASVLAFLLVMAGSRAASARDRLAVVVVAEGDEELGDSLTEVAISSLAERRDHELVGARELRVRLLELPAAPKLEACIVQPACLASLASAVGARRAVIGAVRRNGREFALELALVDTDSGAKDANWSRVVQEDVGSLVSAVAAGVGDLFGAKVSAPNAAVATPTPALDATPPAASPAGLRLDAQPANAHDDKRGATRDGYLGATALALAVVAFSAAAVTGSAAEASLLGGTRAEMQEDLRRREGYATAANGLLIAGGAFSTAAAVLFARWWRDDRAQGR